MKLRNRFRLRGYQLAQPYDSEEVFSKQTDEDALRECLEHIVPEIFGTRSSIIDIQRRRSNNSSFYASDIVTVRVASGDEFNIFLKDFGSYKYPKDALNQRRERELRVYRDLLAQADLGTARYYGSVSDESEGRFWLFLEFVNGTPVRYCDFEYWVMAAGWLGRMQGYFAQHANRLNACDFLLRYDASLFRSFAERGLNAARQISPTFAKRLAPIVSQYHKPIEVMVSQSKTLIHGTYRPVQIVLDTAVEPPRLCPVDWEKAGIGSIFYDLAFFADGFEPSRLDEILNAYHKEATRYGVSVCSINEMKYIVDCYRLHRIFNWLSLSVDRKFPDNKVVELVSMAENVAELVL